MTRNKAYLVALDASVASREYELEPRDEILAGRDGAHCQVIVSGQTISRRHARIRPSTAEEGGVFQLEDAGSTNGLYVNARKVAGKTTLHDGDVIGLGSASIAHLCFQLSSRKHVSLHSRLEAKTAWSLGRTSDNDISIPFEPMVSAVHAVLSQKGGALRIRDTSLNGLWVNGVRVKSSRILPEDTVVIGSSSFHFTLNTDGSLQVSRRECGGDIQIECVNLGLSAGTRGKNEKKILDGISLAIKPGEFVGILGPSGAGKSTLLKALNGYLATDRGEVFYNETSQKHAASMFKSLVAYVPQDDILYQGLPVRQSLDYTARLRFPADVPAQRRQDIIDTVIESLGLSLVENNRIDTLSGGQRKRVSIASELLAKPGLLFLDEPTSGLDPSVEEKIMRLFRDMAGRGATVLITTHILYNLDLLDKIIVMAQGNLVFYGTPAEAVDFFSQGRKEAIRALDIFDILENGALPSSPEDSEKTRTRPDKLALARHYAQAFRNSPCFTKNIVAELSPDIRARLDAPDTGTAPAASSRFARLIRRFTPGALKAFIPLKSSLILAERLFRLRLNSPKQLAFYTIVPVLLALVTLSQSVPGLPDAHKSASLKAELGATLAAMSPRDELLMKGLLSPQGSGDKRGLADIIYALQHEGVQNLPVPMSVMLMAVMAAVFLGTLSVCLEISAEKSVYERERMAGMRIVDYLASKLPLGFAITALQCLLFCALLQLAPNMRGMPAGGIYPVMVAVAWSSVCLGLFISALDPSGGRLSVILAVAAVLPQLILSGGLGPDYFKGMSQAGQTLSACTPARWGLEMLFSTLYQQGGGELDWISGFVRDSVGFQFGRSAITDGLRALGLLAFGGLAGTAFLLKRRDVTP